MCWCSLAARKGFVFVPSTMSPARHEALGRTVHRGAVPAITCLAMGPAAAMASLDVVLADTSRPIHAHQPQQCRMVDAYGHLFTTLLLTSGALGDRFGRRLALVAGLLICGTGSDPLALEEQGRADISGAGPYRHTAGPRSMPGRMAARKRWRSSSKAYG